MQMTNGNWYDDIHNRPTRPVKFVGLFLQLELENVLKSVLNKIKNKSN